MTIKRRRRFRQTTSLSERLHRFADDARYEAHRLSEGYGRSQMLKKVEMAENALRIERLLSRTDVNQSLSSESGKGSSG